MVFASSGARGVMRGTLGLVLASRCSLPQVSRRRWTLLSVHLVESIATLVIRCWVRMWHPLPPWMFEVQLTRQPRGELPTYALAAYLVMVLSSCKAHLVECGMPATTRER